MPPVLRMQVAAHTILFQAFKVAFQGLARNISGLA